MAATQCAYVTATPCPAAVPSSMAARISGAASASRPRNEASIIAAKGASRDPVASQTAAASATSEAAAVKSPPHTASMAIMFSRIGS